MHRNCASKKNERIHEWTLNDENASSYDERLSLLQNKIACKWEMEVGTLRSLSSSELEDSLESV